MADHDRKDDRGRHRVSGARKGLNFRFFIIVCVILAGMGVFMLVQHQLSISAELKSRQIDERIEAQKARQKDLRISLARLKSPERIARLARDELELSEPTGVIYLKYSRDDKGNLVCQSSYEKLSLPPPSRVKTEEPPPPAEESDSPLTRR